MRSQRLHAGRKAATDEWSKATRTRIPDRVLAAVASSSPGMAQQPFSHSYSRIWILSEHPGFCQTSGLASKAADSWSTRSITLVDSLPDTLILRRRLRLTAWSTWHTIARPSRPDGEILSVARMPKRDRTSRQWGVTRDNGARCPVGQQPERLPDVSLWNDHLSRK